MPSRKKNYKRFQKLADNYNFIECFLSGEPITNFADFTIEHYCPRSRVPVSLSSDPNNIKPAIKLINNIKGNLMPCEWEEYKVEACIHALEYYNLKPFQSDLLKRCIYKYKNEGAKDVCAQCVARLTDYCVKSR